ncbi:S8 family peptidase [Bacillus spizizenii]|nr:S8 family peptidase [Bacillus spizizenii]MCY7880560.1 S8 family peptidase [Bacillus spizizenii]MCY7888571.1 S8 family peptidase [Bacillus spizizenii]MCY8324773.1 S8 family peptidase [Bacillus spizizenii]MCY8653868.1 S8 family peptidase [Bacillus spizizenii]
MTYEHLQLIKENINFVRQGRQDKRPDRQIQPRVHGQKLQKSFQSNKEKYEATKKIGEDFIFKIVRDNSKPVNFNKLGLSLLAELQNNISIVEVKDSYALMSNLSDFTAEQLAKTKVVNYSQFANIDEFVFQTPEEKMGPIISKEIIQEDKEYTLDVQLYSGDESLKDIHQKVSLFKEFLSSVQASLLDDCILQSLILIKVVIKGSFINDLLTHSNVYFVDIPQNSIYDIENINQLSISELPNVEQPSDDSPMIGILDSGIIPTHPLLKGSVVASESFGGIKSPFDQQGHGTMVAGIIQFGDLNNALGLKSFKLPFRLLNGRVTDENNKFPDGKILVNVVKEAIEEFISEYNCNIFNLSLGDDRYPYEPNSKIDHWSYILDQIVHEYNVAIIVSAGNYAPYHHNGGILERYYDDLLQDPMATLIPPALAVNCLTVGSKVKDDKPYLSDKKLQHIPVTGKEEASPFTRVGYGYGNSIKPETIAYGGNYSLNTGTKHLNTSDRNLGILSTSLFNPSTGSWFETRSGTSFSAPYITRLIGLIKSRLPFAKGNLLRAILINTCHSETKIKSSVYEKFRNKELKPAQLKEKYSRIQGFGDVREKFLTNSYDHYVTMYYEGEMEINKVNIFEVPITEEIYSKKGKATLHVTLAYNPPCRDSRIDYMGVKITYELYRGLSLEEVTKYTCKPDSDEFEKDKLPKHLKKHKCSLDPSMQEISRGTILRSSHKISSSAASQQKYGDKYYLAVKCQEKWYSGPKQQPYAVVISVEHENEEAAIYEEVRGVLESRNRTRVRQRS